MFHKELAQYADQYRRFVSMRREDGILEVRLHGHGDDQAPVVWDVEVHHGLSHLFYDIARDPANQCVIITGTGGEFIAREEIPTAKPDPSNPNQSVPPAIWDGVISHGRHLLDNLLNIEVPVIGAVNGPALYHSELGLLSDIVLCSDTASFQDVPHFFSNIVPGDGIQTLFQRLINPVRAGYFLLTGEKIPAQRAYELGIVNEVLPSDELLARAWYWARFITARSPLVRKYSRAVLTRQWKKLFQEEHHLGLTLEGMAVGAGARMENGGDASKYAPGHECPPSTPMAQI